MTKINNKNIRDHFFNTLQKTLNSLNKSFFKKVAVTDHSPLNESFCTVLCAKNDIPLSKKEDIIRFFEISQHQEKFIIKKLLKYDFITCKRTYTDSFFFCVDVDYFHNVETIDDALNLPIIDILPRKYSNDNQEIISVSLNQLQELLVNFSQILSFFEKNKIFANKQASSRFLMSQLFENIVIEEYAIKKQKKILELIKSESFLTFLSIKNESISTKAAFNRFKKSKVQKEKQLKETQKDVHQDIKKEIAFHYAEIERLNKKIHNSIYTQGNELAILEQSKNEAIKEFYLKREEFNVYSKLDFETNDLIFNI